MKDVYSLTIAPGGTGHVLAQLLYIESIPGPLKFPPYTILIEEVVKID